MTQGLIREPSTGFNWYNCSETPIATPTARDEFEYLLVVHPDMEVYSKVLAERQSFNEMYQSKHSIKSKPHITIANFVARESMEETLIRWIQRVCSSHRSFHVTLNNYSGVPPHTIYLRVQDHLPFNLLAQKLLVINEYIQSNGCPEVRWSGKPYLNISGKLNEDVYEAAMRDYSQRTFCETFIACELALLRKTSGDWKIVNIFGLIP